MKRLFLGMSAICAILATIYTWSAGSVLSAAVNRKIAQPPADLKIELVEFDGIRGWFVKSKPINSCVLLMHGLRADRTSMVSRARFLNKAGFSTLLFDFQAHGESPGEAITFGYNESNNARSAFQYLKKQKCKKIGSIGQSLGGAASLLGKTPFKVDALVLESVYSTIETAISNRLEIRFGSFARFTMPLLSVQIPLRQKIYLEDLKPVEAIKKYQGPVFIVGGDLDKRTTLAETRLLYDNAPGIKELWVVKGAAHVDFHRFMAEEYEKRVLGFFSRFL